RGQWIRPMPVSRARLLGAGGLLIASLASLPATSLPQRAASRQSSEPQPPSPDQEPDNDDRGADLPRNPGKPIADTFCTLCFQGVAQTRLKVIKMSYKPKVAGLSALPPR